MAGSPFDGIFSNTSASSALGGLSSLPSGDDYSSLGSGADTSGLKAQIWAQIQGLSEPLKSQMESKYSQYRPDAAGYLQGFLDAQMAEVKKIQDWVKGQMDFLKQIMAMIVPNQTQLDGMKAGITSMEKTSISQFKIQGSSNSPI